MKNKAKPCTVKKPSFLGAVHQERGDFLLPQIVDYMVSKKWIDPRPPYQRRQVWDDGQKSKFLESLILNLPVPPLFLYEKTYGQWEIMDGQQRSNAIVDFYEGKLTLRGLKRWKELNKCTYKTCPDFVRKSFDRRRIQVTTVLAEPNEVADLDVRKEVFERLNTGGQPLRPQEIRNCLYAGEFCDLLDELSSLPSFTSLWKIPPHQTPKKLKTFSADLKNNKKFARMEDCELVLRFFAFNEKSFFSGGVKSALDKCMEYYYTNNDKETIMRLKERYVKTIDLVYDVLGEEGIMIPNKAGKKSPAKQMYDALMASMLRYNSHADEIKKKKATLRKRISSLVNSEEGREALISRHDNRNIFRERRELICGLMDDVLSE